MLKIIVLSQSQVCVIDTSPLDKFVMKRRPHIHFGKVDLPSYFIVNDDNNFKNNFLLFFLLYLWKCKSNS